MSEKSVPLADIRTDYTRDVLLEDAHLNTDPFTLFNTWLNQAIDAGQEDATAMTLATVASNLRPSSRIVLLKGFDTKGLIWFTNYQSRKAEELAGNPYAALQFHWVQLQRVVRIEGIVEKVAAAESDAYFASRPLESRIGAWASPQSRPIANRATLEHALDAVRTLLEDPANPPRPPHWGGFRLVPDRWEFWQGRVSRLHDRLAFTNEASQTGTWRIQRLAP